MDFSFNKEKMKKECHKLIKMANFGEDTLMGYVDNLKKKYLKTAEEHIWGDQTLHGQCALVIPKSRFSIMEFAFIQAVVDSLLPKDDEFIFSEDEQHRVVDWNKRLIKSLFDKKTLELERIDYTPSDDELDYVYSWYTYNNEPVLAERLFIRDFFLFATTEGENMEILFKNCVKGLEVLCGCLGNEHILDYLLSLILEDISVYNYSSQFLQKAICSFVEEKLPVNFGKIRLYLSRSDIGSYRKMLEYIFSTPHFGCVAYIYLNANRERIRDNQNQRIKRELRLEELGQYNATDNS